MEREIKFRAWDELSKFMISNDDLIIRDFNPLRQWNKFKKMQYTGLKDKNGVEIYEGDIIKSKKSSHIIKWDESEARYIAVFNMKENILKDGCHISKRWIENYCKEVVGNIYENPELLEEEK